MYFDISSQKIIEFNKPYKHYIIDNFLTTEWAKKLSNEFLDYNDPAWFYYDNPLENKRTLNDLSLIHI